MPLLASDEDFSDGGSGSDDDGLKALKSKQHTETLRKVKFELLFVPCRLCFLQIKVFHKDFYRFTLNAADKLIGSKSDFSECELQVNMVPPLCFLSARLFCAAAG